MFIKYKKRQSRDHGLPRSGTGYRAQQTAKQTKIEWKKTKNEGINEFRFYIHSYL